MMGDSKRWSRGDRVNNEANKACNCHCASDDSYQTVERKKTSIHKLMAKRLIRDKFFPSSVRH